jgi:hypothetical protein
MHAHCGTCDRNPLHARRYGNASGAIVHAWRPGHWYTNIFEVGAASTPLNGSQQLYFERGGIQGAEGVKSGEAWCTHLHTRLRKARHIDSHMTRVGTIH